MHDFRVTSEFWISSYMKRLELQAIPFFIIKKGDKKAGAIIIRVSDMRGKSKIFVQCQSQSVDRRWVELANGLDFEMDEVIQKQREFDLDLWILEIEERNNIHLLDDVLLLK